MTVKLRKTQWSDKDMTEHARDVQKALDSIPSLGIFVLTNGLGKTPIVPIPSNKKPIALEAIRIVGATENTVVNHGTAVSWTWRPDLGGCLITRIQGMTLGDGQPYTTTFRITYGAF